VNEDAFQPLDIICPDRTVFTALPPAPTSNCWEAMMAATDVEWKRLPKRSTEWESGRAAARRV
jgi:N-methylhydantoinase B